MILGENFFELLNSLPSNVREIINKIPKDIIEKTEEIRLRLNRPLMIDINNEEKLVSSEGKFVKNIKDSYIITHEDCNKALQLISKSSLYAFEEELKNGYITLKGGYRVGIVGKCVIENGYIKTMRNISGYNYRIMRELKGVSDNIISYIVKSPKEVKNTLIISPPQCGKTTLIRDIARNISNGIDWLGFKGLNIGIIDERSEISACYNGVPQVDVGIRTDVLDGCPKSSGILMMIRSMSPKVIITDELGKQSDIKAIYEALNAGISVISTIHGKNLQDVLQKHDIKDIISSNTFDRYIILSSKLGAGTVEEILDKDFHTIFKGPKKGGNFT